ncbi:hypothetical protein ACLOJK_010617 [Asimina triloba]
MKRVESKGICGGERQLRQLREGENLRRGRGSIDKRWGDESGDDLQGGVKQVVSHESLVPFLLSPLPALICPLFPPFVGYHACRLPWFMVNSPAAAGPSDQRLRSLNQAHVILTAQQG